MVSNDKGFNTLFVKEVQRHPCLYDPNHDSYCNRDLQERTWYLIAKKMSGSVDECKNRWKNLRGGFTRYLLTQARRSEKNIKPYYMMDALRFLLPFTKQRMPIKKRSFEVGGESYNSDDENHSEFGDSLDVDIKVENQDGVGSEEGSSRKRVALSDPLEDQSTSFINNNAPVNADLDFFKSLLPDISLFNLQQKRRFKLKVLQVIDEISSENPAAASSSPGFTVLKTDSSNDSITYEYDIV